jgi:hypothetical protein
MLRERSSLFRMNGLYLLKAGRSYDPNIKKGFGRKHLVCFQIFVPHLLLFFFLLLYLFHHLAFTITMQCRPGFVFAVFCKCTVVLL